MDKLNPQAIINALSLTPKIVLKTKGPISANTSINIKPIKLL